MNWTYEIKAYWQDGDGWTPAAEGEATAWFGFRECGEDRRCFGVFPTREDAERAMELMKKEEVKLSHGMRR